MTEAQQTTNPVAESNQEQTVALNFMAMPDVKPIDPRVLEVPATESITWSYE